MKLCVEDLTERILLSPSTMALPPIAVMASQMVSTIDQVIATVQNDVSSIEKTLAQEIAQEAAFVGLELDHLLGINPNPPNPSPDTAVPQAGSSWNSGSGMGRGNGSGSGSGSGAMTTTRDAPNPSLNYSTQQKGHGSGSGSSATTSQKNAAEHGLTRVQPLTSGSGTGSGSGSATVSGEVWLDSDGDGLLDNGESGLQGITVNLDNASGQTLQTTTTDANGNYLFNVNPGSGTGSGSGYEIQVVIPDGDVATIENASGGGINSNIDYNGFSNAFALAPGGNVAVNAGLVPFIVTKPTDDGTGNTPQSLSWAINLIDQGKVKTSEINFNICIGSARTGTSPSRE
jgi:hypothetical protein